MLKKILVFIILFTSIVSSVLAKSYIREYTYEATELDTKITSRALAIQEVKRDLLNEIGTFVSAKFEMSRSSSGNVYGSDDLTTLTAGVTKLEVLDEKWSGKSYYIKAQIIADPAEVLKSIDKFLELDKKQQHIEKVEGELLQEKTTTAALSKSLIDSKKEVENALREIMRLKKALNKRLTKEAKRLINVAYVEQVDVLISNQWLTDGISSFERKDYEKAYYLFKKAADSGNMIAQNNLGVMYHDGVMNKDEVFIAQDYKKAFYWYEKSAEQGYVVAFTNLGVMYRFGFGVKENSGKSIHWFKRAADESYPLGQYFLGSMYEDESGANSNIKLALYWYERAAENGHDRAMERLGVLYEDGNGVKQDYEQALYWYKKSAEQGFEVAQERLGSLYENGDGITQDYGQALYWYQKAADQGYYIAQTNLGRLYEEGKGVAKNHKRAVYWYQKAASHGHKEAKRMIKGMQ